MKKRVPKKIKSDAKKLAAKTERAIRTGILAGSILSKKYVAPRLKKASKVAKAEYKTAAKKVKKDSKILGSEGQRLLKEAKKSVKRLKKRL